MNKQCNHPECASYNQCIFKLRADLRYPTDTASLYGKRIYDNQTANRRCYEENPIDIVEGFGCPSRKYLSALIKIAIVAVAVYIIYVVITNATKETIKLDIDSPIAGTEAAPIMTVVPINPVASAPAPAPVAPVASVSGPKQVSLPIASPTVE